MLDMVPFKKRRVSKSLDTLSNKGIYLYMKSYFNTVKLVLRSIIKKSKKTNAKVLRTSRLILKISKVLILINFPLNNNYNSKNMLYAK